MSTRKKADVYGLDRRGETTTRSFHISMAVWSKVLDAAELAGIGGSDLVRAAIRTYLLRKPCPAEDTTTPPAFSREVRLNDAIWARVQKRAVEEGVTDPEVIRRAIAAHLERIARARGNGHEQGGRGDVDGQGGGPAAGG